MNKARRWIWLGLGLVFVSIAGCGEPSPVGVSGEVTFDGQPLPDGIVVFEPTPGSDAQRRDASIVDGRFTLPDEEGMLPGQEFRVAIKAFRKTGRKYPNADMGASYDETEQYLPERFNTSSTLRITISPDAKENHFAFNLLSPPK